MSEIAPDRNDAASRANRRWPQFSLRSLIAVTVILLLGISHWNTSRELSSTRDELNQLKRATGELVVRDPTELHVLAIRTTVRREQAFLWRIYVPPGATYHLSLELDELVPSTFNGPKSLSFPIQGQLLDAPGEWQVWYEYDSKNDRNEWDTAMTLATPSDDTESRFESLPLASVPWVDSEWKKDFRVAGAYGTDTFAVGTPADLLVLRASPHQQPSTQSSMPPDAWKLRVRLTPVP
jgi:hypothetical protein